MENSAHQDRTDARVEAVRPRTRRTPRWRALVLVVSSGPGLAAADHCDDLAGRLVSVEGEVSVADLPARMNDEICSGESVVIGALSRAAVRLEDTQTVVRIDQNSTFLIKPSDTERSWLELIKGTIYLFSRRPESLRVDTPYVNAMIDGTEFVADTSDASSEFTVIEGSVLVGNALGEVRLEAGETASAGAGQSLRRRVVIEPLDAVQWALHYPPIGASEDTSEAVRAAAELLARGDVGSAEALLLEAPEDAASLALQGMIAVTRNHPVDANRLAEQAVNTDAGSSLAYTALSYAQQARFEIDQALTSAGVAVRNDARNADALARLAELQLGVDDTAGALESARRAIVVAPDNSRARTVLGFVHLIRLEVDEAQTAFNGAVVRDPGDPLPRLGLGLATIRDGRLVEGREHLEVAAALDPNDALVRSYLGKAYAEEREPADAAAQYALAQTLDPQDPTPWLYDALLDQALNRPVKAYDKINRAIALNDNRLIYQSRLLVDKSAAAGSLSLARIYTDLGFEQPAINESTRSIAADPTNFSAYRFLADSYADRERHEASRRSVLFQASLLQPLTIDPVQPYAQESDLLTLPGTDPVDPSIREYSPLFDREGSQLAGSLVAGDGTFGNNLVLSGLHDRFAYSLGQFHYKTDGFRHNAGTEHNVHHGFIQGQISSALFVQADLQDRLTDQENFALNFNPAAPDSGLRVEREATSPRVGLRAELGPRSTLLLATRVIDRMERTAEPMPAFVLRTSQDVDGYETFVRFVYRGSRISHDLGVDAHELDQRFATVFDIEPCPTESCRIDPGERKSSYANYYYYADFEMGQQLHWTLGLGLAIVDDEKAQLEKQYLNPKFGLRWRPKPSHELRLSTSRGIARGDAADLMLEPTVLAGFNQVFDDFAATRYTNSGLAYDVQVSPTSLTGIEIVHRELDVRVLQENLLTLEDTGSYDEPQQETSVRGYWSQTLRPHLSLGLALHFDRSERDDSRNEAGLPILSFPLRVETMSIPISVRYYYPSGFFVHSAISFVQQSIERILLQSADGGTEVVPIVAEDSESFTNIDLSLGMRLPTRRVTLRLDVSNLLDETHRYQGGNIRSDQSSNPRFAPERTIVGRVSFSFR